MISNTFFDSYENFPYDSKYSVILVFPSSLYCFFAGKSVLQLTASRKQGEGSENALVVLRVHG